MIPATLRWQAALVLSCAAFAVCAEVKLPARVTASYDLLRNGHRLAAVQETFERSGNDYRILSETRPAGVFALFSGAAQRVESRGSIGDTGLRPLHFEQSRSDDPSRHSAADFDWPRGRLAMRHAGQVEEVPLPDGTQDRLSVMYQFMFLSFERSRTLAFAMTTGNKLEQYRYDVRADARVQTPAAAFDTLHLVKQRIGNENSTELWLARSRRLFPVRMLIVEKDGERLEQVLTHLDIAY